MVRRGGFLVLVALAACSGSDVPAAVTVPVASDLAPSQVTASTVVAPELPPPCRIDQLSFAQGASEEDGVVVVDITNTGDQWCEADLSASVAVAPEMEPDVWIDPGAVAQLRVELDTTSCAAPAPVDTLGLDVDGEPVAVEIERIDVCSLALAALYPL